MASPAHCFYCFESLEASFQRCEPPKLDSVLDLYEKYTQNQHGNDTERVEGNEQEEEGRGRAAQGDEETQITSSDAPASITDGLRPQNPSISRLQKSSSSSRSSSASSPSTLSAQSSQSQLTGSSSATSISTKPTYASRLSVTDSYPLFVTWNTISRSGNKSLRGCIGTFEGLPLENGLQTYALTSAFDDTRFSPIPASLLPALSCSLTLLADFEECSDALDWTLGTHGIRISFIWKNKRYGATYLPDVAVEQGWDKEETLDSLMKKAGWDNYHQQSAVKRVLRGSRGEEQSKPWEEVESFKVVRYTGLRANASYSDWKQWKDWTKSIGKQLQ